MLSLSYKHLGHCVARACAYRACKAYTHNQTC